MQIILYSTGCPRCMVIQKKLTEKNINYTKVTSEEDILALGVKEVPILSVDGNLMGFKNAVEWINSR